MPTNEPIKKHDDIHEEERIEEERIVATEPDVSDTHRRNLVITAWVAGGVAVILLFAAGFVVLGTVLNHRIASRYPTTETTTQTFRTRGTSPFGYGHYSRTEVNNNTVSTTVYTSLTGVVVEVDSGKIVVAGNGARTTIVTNSSTQYDNDTKPAVNDTVTVIGTTSGNTTTATEIGVMN